MDGVRHHCVMDYHYVHSEGVLMPFITECPYPDKPSWDTVLLVEAISSAHPRRDSGSRNSMHRDLE